MRAARPGVGGADPPSWATREEGNDCVWACLDLWRFEPYSSSEVEAYSTGTRRHRVPAKDRKDFFVRNQHEMDLSNGLMASEDNVWK